MIRADRHTYKVFNQEFTIDKRFQVTKELGHGAYGIVCAAKYTGTPDGPGVAIKKVTNIFSKNILCKRALRELKLLNHFRGHKNITCLYDMDIVDTNNFNELYLYEELMECDMHQIIRSGQPLTDAHYQSFVYQILAGVKYIHSADVLHRDLKPGNLLVNADCELKICDFGLARGFSSDDEKNAGFLTEYVATRWYRAPEIMLSFQSYTKAIDIWSVGCILAELLGGKPLFKGKNYVDQLNQILHYLGTPSEETLKRIGSPRAQEYVRGLPFMPKIPFSTLFPTANPEALDLLEKMLAFDPAERVTVEEALEHPYLKIWHDPRDEPVCPTPFDFSFEEVNDMEAMKQMILDEVVDFRAMVRKPVDEQTRIRDEQIEEQRREEEKQEVERQQKEAERQKQQQQEAERQQHQQQQHHPQQQDSPSTLSGFSDSDQSANPHFYEYAGFGVGSQTSDMGQPPVIQRKDSLGIPEEDFKYQDPPPKPQESGRQGDGDLELELEYGLDGWRS
ncbi:kinase-like domain-containing protein [Yarrowia lipolytica]|nr:Mitogen-activated protein kinase SLT2/MPK1 [Yarrowia lipolytica]RDW34563.1 kinase-like domain-containing protein [Yarrowia lipolytica]RDW39351.1 kinase-like domain-containing protein [Yarrowia lipolytica]RDW43449.1 kinase-like domain-containing protein [Yarrowia lipolytica]RDW50293.1 kinase-like domain-containing protein [Yarrowia lipolytica]